VFELERNRELPGSCAPALSEGELVLVAGGGRGGGGPDRAQERENQMMVGLGVEYDPETGLETYNNWVNGTSQYEYEEALALAQTDQGIEQLAWDPSLDTWIDELEWDPSLDTVPPGTTYAQIQKQANAIAALAAAGVSARTAASKLAASKTPAAKTQVVACKSGVDASGKCKDLVPGLANNYLVMGAGIFGMFMIVLAMRR